MKLSHFTWLLVPVLFGCSTTYLAARPDVEKLQSGRAISGVSDANGEQVDLSHYAFDYRLPDKPAPQRVPGIESLNHLAETGALAKISDLAIVPGRDDRPWERMGLGGGVGLLSGFGIGFAVSNRIAIERQGQQGPNCSDCSTGTVLLGSFIAAGIGLVAGGLIAYYAGTGLGELKPATLSFLAPPPAPLLEPAPASEPASQASMPASQP